jgi:precorrin-2 dehydrogenase/sirohydrochlorin ferrochelatase
MGYLPIFIDVSDRTCVVIGGGEIAERKTRSLIEGGANVVVISPKVTAGLAAMNHAGAVRHLARTYRPGDLAGAWLAFDATGDDATTLAIVAEARERGVPINVADEPERCTFIAPSVLRRGGLQLAVSTGGASPALARRIREELEGQFGREYELIVELLARARQWLRMHEPDQAERARRLGMLVHSDLLESLKASDFAAADAIVKRILHAGLAEIGFDPTRTASTIDPQSCTPLPRTSEVP